MSPLLVVNSYTSERVKWREEMPSTQVVGEWMITAQGWTSTLLEYA